MYSYIYSVLNGTKYSNSQASIFAINGTKEAVEKIEALVPYTLKGVFTMNDCANGNFTMNFMFEIDQINMYTMPKGNGFVYNIATSNKKMQLGRDECLKYLDKVRAILTRYYKGHSSARKYQALIDVDATLVHFHEALRMLLATKGYKYDWRKLTDYHGVSADLIGVDWKIAREGMQTPRMYEDDMLHKYKGVDEGLALLRQHASTNGYTGSENNKTIYDKRFEFCKANQLIPNVFIGSKPVIQGFDVLFDDNPYVISNWLDAGNENMRFYMIEQPYNIHIPLVNKWSRVQRVKSFYHGVKQFIRDIS